MKFSTSSLFLVAATLLSSCSVDAQISRQECVDQGGNVVGDIGNGDIFQAGYRCESDGLVPMANILQEGEENIAIEGEVCCGSATTVVEDPMPEDTVSTEREELSRQECTDKNGAIVGDIGNGSIHRADYKCDSNGQSPIGTIVPLEGEPIASEGEVCCGPVTASVTTDGDKVESAPISGGPGIRALQVAFSSLLLFL